MTNETDAVAKAPAAPPAEGAQPQPGGGKNDNVHTPMDPTVAKMPLKTQGAVAGRRK